MICEPNFSLPQKIQLHSLRQSNNENSQINPPVPVRPKISYIQNDYDIMPKFSDQFVHLNTVLSLKENNYLRCRWNQFLNKTPNVYVKIRLYSSVKREMKVLKARRKILTGNFYGADNKLAPIPQLADPRK
ncbi:uncharacterized protein LOC142219563 [Haematobia irritans]|uniref:uncharacterized protein LOC142219563 n=1 Tax=Haematobia irritans TaxID=7368 RepID=UPI003F4FC95B